MGLREDGTGDSFTWFLLFAWRLQAFLTRANRAASIGDRLPATNSETSEEITRRNNNYCSRVATRLRAKESTNYHPAAILLRIFRRSHIRGYLPARLFRKISPVKFALAVLAHSADPLLSHHRANTDFRKPRGAGSASRPARKNCPNRRSLLNRRAYRVKIFAVL